MRGARDMADFSGNRVTRDTGARYPILQGPMAWLARSTLASAVSAAGAVGIIESASGEFEVVKAEVEAMRRLTPNAFGVNLALASLARDDRILDWLADRGPRFVTTSGGDPRRYAARLQAGGAKVYHAVTTLDSALGAAEAGVNGLIVEGAEGGAVSGANPAHLFVLLQAIRRRTDLPLIASGGIADGHGMAAAFALGAEGIQMGTRFLSAVESPAHEAYRRAIVGAEVGSTVLLRRGEEPPLRALRSPVTEAIQRRDIYLSEVLRASRRVHLEGRLDLGLAPAGESAGLIEAVLPAEEIVAQTVAGFWAEIDRLAALRGPLKPS